MKLKRIIKIRFINLIFLNKKFKIKEMINFILIFSVFYDNLQIIICKIKEKIIIKRKLAFGEIFLINLKMVFVKKTISKNLIYFILFKNMIKKKYFFLKKKIKEIIKEQVLLLFSFGIKILSVLRTFLKKFKKVEIFKNF